MDLGGIPFDKLMKNIEPIDTEVLPQVEMNKIKNTQNLQKVTKKRMI